MQKQYDCESYIICHNGSDVIHPSKVDKGTYVSTGQPHLEEFDCEEEWKARLTELGYDTSKLESSRPEIRKRDVRERVMPGGERFKGIMEKYRSGRKSQEEAPLPEQKRRGRPRKTPEE